MERSFERRTCSIWRKFHSFMLSSPNSRWWHRYRRWISWNWWLHVKSRKWNMHFSTGKFPTGKQDYLLKIPLIPGNFQVERPENVCNLLTSQPEFPEFLGKLKAPLVTWLFLNTSYTDTKQTWGDHYHDSPCVLWEWRLTDSRFHGGSK